uniref:Uncharacterized protein n=1 Tax=Zea mays TaxID=4577 RepID=B6SZQ3_MAIZE|nr:hypothetical protein [Zea mays]
MTEKEAPRSFLARLPPLDRSADIGNEEKKRSCVTHQIQSSQSLLIQYEIRLPPLPSLLFHTVPSNLFLVELMGGEKQQNLQGSTENDRASCADGERFCG